MEKHQRIELLGAAIAKLRAAGRKQREALLRVERAYGGPNNRRSLFNEAIKANNEAIRFYSGVLDSERAE